MRASSFFTSLALCISPATLHPLLGQELTRRQVTIGAPSPVPSQCTSTCNPVNDRVSLGCPVTACCTTTFETEYYNCLVCVGMALDAANYSTAQNSLNLLYTTCVDMGFVLPRMELPGQTDNNSSVSGVSKTTIGAAVGDRWVGIQSGALIGAAVLLGVTALW